MEFEQLSGRILGAAVDVHKALGPGFLESIYQRAMEVALTNRNISFSRQKQIQVEFENVDVGLHILDLVVEEQIIVELKAVKAFEDIHPFRSTPIVPQGHRLAHRIAPEFQCPDLDDQTCGFVITLTPPFFVLSQFRVFVILLCPTGHLSICRSPIRGIRFMSST
jgi:GxxExxY protein